MSPVASFHLVTERRGRQPLVIARLGLDRRRMRPVDGLSFVRTLGTGRGANTGPSIDARRSALFAVWSDEAALDRFVSSHPIAHRWHGAGEVWHARLRLSRGHGRWGDLDIADLGEPDVDRSTDGPVAVLTRASIRAGATVQFLRASRSFGGATAAASGNLAVVGVGERPLGRLGTFSLWEDEQAARRFATTDDGHRAAMRVARAERWFTEELFAVFRPIGSAGTWDGRNPLAGQPW